MSFSLFHEFLCCHIYCTLFVFPFHVISLLCIQLENAIDKVQELIDNPYVLKSMAFMVIDTLLMELFPELTGKLAGMDAAL